MAEKTTQTIAIDAEPGKVMAVIADIGAYPEWVSEYKETEVLDTDSEGRVKRARLVLDAGVLKDTQVLGMCGPRTAEGHLDPCGKFPVAFAGRDIPLAPKGSGTEVTYELAVDLQIPMIGMLKRKAERKITDSALKDLKKRVESDR